MLYLRRELEVQTSKPLKSVLFQCLTALEQDVVMVLDENVINSLLEIVRRHSEDEELLSLICPLLMMISADGWSLCFFGGGYSYFPTFVM